VYRLGPERLRLRFAALDAIARAGSLSVTDSRTLRWWLKASPKAVEVELPSGASQLRVYLEPVSLALLLDDVSTDDDPRLESRLDAPDARRAVAHAAARETANSNIDPILTDEAQPNSAHADDQRPTDIRQ